mmetsp:Transcript_21210/g.43455  ORF Transcript_21210/g.43455 Transcript_21210/m.43455 type:complete len:461 (-) Transcript_21210:1592-2974(-)
MEVNKGEAERCRDMGASALRDGNYSRAAKLLGKSLRLYPLPGVEALLGQAESKLRQEQSGGVGGGGGATSASASASSASASAASNGSASASTTSAAAAAAAPPRQSYSRAASGPASTTRGYTEAQAQIVKEVLRAKEGGSGAHYRVLEIQPDANDAQIKKAYRKLALKLHPDKNSAPHADEAFKAVGLAYATLSDPQKRTIYDRYGEEDPDNRGGGGGGGGFPGGMRRGNMHFNGQEVNPEDIFNAFFGGQAGMGGMGMGGPGFRVYTSGMGGPGFAFHGGMPRQRRGGGGAQQQRARQQQEDEQIGGGLAQLLQLLPLFILFALSFFNFPGDHGSGATGGSSYFSLTHSPPFVHPLTTKVTTVRDIPFYVTDKFLRTIQRDQFQLGQVERMVEKSYRTYLVNECKNQKRYKMQLERGAREKRGVTEEERNRLLRRAQEFELSRCIEFENLFPTAGHVSF